MKTTREVIEALVIAGRAALNDSRNFSGLSDDSEPVLRSSVARQLEAAIEDALKLEIHQQSEDLRPTPAPQGQAVEACAREITECVLPLRSLDPKHCSDREAASEANIEILDARQQTEVEVAEVLRRHFAQTPAAPPGEATDRERITLSVTHAQSLLEMIEDPENCLPVAPPPEKLGHVAWTWSAANALRTALQSQQPKEDRK